MLQVFMTSAELYEYCFPSQELLRLKQLQIKLGDCLNLSDCLSGTCFGPLHRQGCPVKTRPAIPAQTKAQRPGLVENQQTFIKTTQPRAQSPKPSQDQSPEPRAQSPAQSPEQTKAHSPEPRAQKAKAKAKPPKTPDPNPIQFLLPIWTIKDLGIAKGFSPFVCLFWEHDPFKTRSRSNLTYGPVKTRSWGKTVNLY